MHLRRDSFVIGILATLALAGCSGSSNSASRSAIEALANPSPEVSPSSDVSSTTDSGEVLAENVPVPNPPVTNHSGSTSTPNSGGSSSEEESSEGTTTPSGPTYTYTSTTVSYTKATAWFGSVAVNTNLVKALSVSFANRVGNITNPVVTFPDGFAFAGGSFPGAGGSCSTSIAVDTCTMAIRFSPTAIQKYEGNLNFSFDHDGTHQSVNIALHGEGGLVIGSTEFALNSGVAAGLNAPLAMGVTGGKYYIVDTGNSRIKFYDSEPTIAFPTAPAFVLGQQNTSGMIGSNDVSGSSMSAPSSVTKCGDKLVVADTANHRVLIWNAMPTASGQSADKVLGQLNMTLALANRGNLAPDGGTLSSPYGVVCYEVGTAKMLFVSDSGNHRVLVWNSLDSLQNGQVANQVLGQATAFVGTKNRTDTVTPAQNSMRQPTGLAISGTKLFIADTSNNRVIAYDLPTVDTNLSMESATASLVLGQLNYSSSASAATTMYAPEGIAANSSSLLVADRAQNRILIYSSVPTAVTSPDLVIGQPDLATTTANNTGSGAIRNNKSLSSPRGVSFIGNKVAVTDTSNSRILVFNVVPTGNHVSANLIIGQIDETLAISNSESSISATQINPLRLFADAQRLIVPDGHRHRVLIWNTFPTSSNQAPDFVLGQEDFTSGAANKNTTPACDSLNTPTSAFWDGSRLYVGDEGNNRVMIWNAASIANGADADVILGQPDCSTVTSGNSTQTAKFSSPRGVYVVGRTLFVSDNLNNRVQGFTWAENGSLTTGQNATFSIMQSASCLNNWISLSKPEQAFSFGTKLFIPDRSRHRLIVFNSIPDATTPCPDAYELGQVSYASSGITYANISNVGGGAFDADGNMYMVDRGNNNRIEKWNAANIPTTSGLLPTTPDAVWGALDRQSYFGIKAVYAYGGYGYTDSYTPAIVGDKLVVPDRSGRVYIVPKP